MIYKVTMELELKNQKEHYPSSYWTDSDMQSKWIQDAIYDQLEDGEDLLSCEVTQLKTAEGLV